MRGTQETSDAVTVGKQHGLPRRSSNGAEPLRLVFWETTAGCNLSCVHCRRLDVAREMMQDDLTTEEACALIDGIAEVGQPILVLSGGEPLIRPDIFCLARYAVTKGLPVSLATNGTLIDASTALAIHRSGIRRCAVSLDGATPETHDLFRRQIGSFDAALQGIASLRWAGCEVQINTTLARHNVEELKEIYALALRLRAVALHVFMLVPVGCGVQIANDQMLSATRYEEALNTLYDLSREGKIHIKATCAPHYYRILRQRAKAEGRKLDLASEGMAALTKGCLAGTAVCFVSHKGQVFPCGYLPVEAGNIHTTPFGQIWRHSPVFWSLRNPDFLEGKCGLCEYRNVCAGCRARAFAATGDYLAEEPFCLYEPGTSRRHSPRLCEGKE